MAFQLIRCGLASAKLNPLARYSSHAAHKFSHALQSAPAAELTVLDNGIRVATEKTSSPTATIGVWVEGGSRYESNELNGIANFIERLLFKGSKNRSKKQLEKDVYGLGAVLNSFNDRESSGFYATVAPGDVSKASELLADLIQNPSLSSESIEETRNEVLKELEDKQSDYEQVVMDYLHSVAFQNTSLAQSKFGTTENIQRFTKDHIEQGLDLFFKGPRLVIAASGNVEHDQIVKLAQQGFKGISTVYEKNGIPDSPIGHYTGSDIRVRDDSMDAAYVAFGVEGPGYNNPDYVAMKVASSLYAPWDLTHGGGENLSNYYGLVSASDHLAQAVKPFNLAYKDTALWGVYFIGERMKLEDMCWQIQYQWKRLYLEIANNEIRFGKNNLLTKLITQRDGSASNANSIASDILRFGRRISLEEWQSKIAQVNSDKIHQMGEKYFWDQCHCSSSLGPIEELPVYDDLRMKMSWVRY